MLVTLTCGVLHGSTLSSFLFNIDIKLLSEVTYQFGISYYQWADVTQLYILNLH